MRSRRRTTKWNLVFQCTAIALVLVSGVVLVPLYLRFIPLDLYGAWLATGNVLAWLTMVDPGLSAVLQQRAGMAYGKGDVGELNGLLTGGVLLSGAISLVVLVAGFASSRFVIGWLNLTATPENTVVERAFALAVVGTAMMIFSYGITAFNIGLQSSLGIGLVFVATMVTSLVLTIVLLYRGVGLLALPIGLIVRGAGLTLGNAGYLLWRYADEEMRFRISLRGVGALARLSSYTFLGRGMGVIVANLDVFVLTRYLGAELAPVYALTCKAPGMSRMVLERPSVAFMPAISNLIGAGEIEKARTVLLRLMRIYIWLLGLIAGGFLLLNDDFVALWVGPALFAGHTINVAIVLSLVVAATNTSLGNLCFSMGNVKGNSMATLAQGVIAVPLMLLGVWYWGMLGVAFAPLVAMLAVSAWYYPFAFSRLLKLEKVDLLAMAREVAAVTIAVVISMRAIFWVPATTWPIFALAIIAFSIIYLAVLVSLSRVFRAEASGVVRGNRISRILRNSKDTAI
jgi:O-antigen/teichoic acid export membrane protein